MPIKTFRGLLAADGIEHIRLQTNNGRTGYRIVKFQLMLPNSAANIKSSIQIYKQPQTTTTDAIDFSNNTLLAAGQISAKSDQTPYPEDMTVVFDSEIFNQDIYVTHHDEQAADLPVNWYIELEVINLTSNSAEYTTLKDIRARNTRGQAFP